MRKRGLGRLLVMSCIALVVTLYSGGCALIRLQENIDQIDKLSSVDGGITSHKALHGVIILTIIKMTEKRPELIDYQVMPHPGKFSLLLKPGNYRLFAYEDANNDRRYQEAERAVKSAELKLHPGEHLTGVMLHLPNKPNQEIIDAVRQLRKDGIIKLRRNKKNLGKIVSLDEPYFSRTNAALGMWEPVKFAQKVPFGLFLLQKYDPNKIPVIFVHGINGSPKDFSYIIPQLDKSKFQPWIFYYPSGLRLQLIANFLNNSINNLVDKYHIKRLYIVAHSMGGLVSRAAINENLRSNPHSVIKLFVSISSPWQGHNMAKFGVEHAPVIMPVWYDMSPDSNFLKELYAKPWPDKLPYYLLFSYRGGSNSAGETNDGVVTIASELRLDAQRAALLVRGFNENHTSILRSKSVAALLNKILEATRRGKRLVKNCEI